LSIAHFLKHTDWDIEWAYDPDIPAVSVGEGTTLVTPHTLLKNLGWNWLDIKDLGFTPKTGIYKENWGGCNKYTHSFPLGNTGMHFNAVGFQDKVFNTLKDSNRITLIEENLTGYENLDTNFVMVCSGSPKKSDDFNYHDEIPVNAAYVTQCFWDNPRFTDTLTIARPYGWVFAIPLKNRCSIGYLYNKNINNLEEIKKDVLNVFNDLDLEPSDVTNSINFNNYSRKVNYTGKVVYNGNASFFLEPLEATSLSTAEKVYRYAFDMWYNQLTCHRANEKFNAEIKDVKAMICLHYMAGSIFNTPFWCSAKEKANIYIKDLFSNNDYWCHNLTQSLNPKNLDDVEIGSWNRWSYRYNVDKLGLTKKVEEYSKCLT